MKPAAFHIYLLALTLVIIGFLYYEMFFIPPMADDLWHISNAKHYGLNVFFKGEQFVRIWERILFALNYTIHDEEHYFQSAFSFFGFMLGIVLVYLLARRWWPDRTSLPLVAAILFAFHSANTASVYQTDTFSQLLNAILILVCLLWFTSRPAMLGGKFHLVGIPLACATMLTKETALGVVFGLPLVTVALRYLVYRDPTREILRDMLIGYVGLFVFFGLYMMMRAYLGATLGIEVQNVRYTLTLSPFILAKNIAMLTGSVAYIGSTIEIMVTPDATRVAISALLTLISFALMAGGVWAARQSMRIEESGDGWAGGTRRELVYLGIAVFMLAAGQFPAMLTLWVSEQYSLLLTPFYALAAGYLAYRGVLWLAQSRRWGQTPRFAVAALLLAVYSGWMGYGVADKLNVAEIVATRAEDFRNQLRAWHAGLPAEGGKVVICFSGDLKSAVSGEKSYSIFSQTNGNLAKANWRYFRLHERPIEVTSPDDPACAYHIKVAGNQLTFPTESQDQ